MSQQPTRSLSNEQTGQLILETAKLKRTLKSLSKNQLVVLVIQQVNLAVEQQNINKVLLERLKELEPQEKGPENV